MKEKYEEYKKSKEYKMHIFRNIILVLLLIAIGYVGYNYYINGVKKSNALYSYKITNDEVILIDNNKEVTYYSCNNCKIYKDYFNNGLILLQEADSIYLYDLVSNTMVTPLLQDIYFIYNDEGTDIKNIEYFVVKDLDGNEGLLDRTGKTTIDISYQNIGRIKDNTLVNYNFYNNFIAVKNNDKWGLLSMDVSKGVMDFQYDDIIVSPYQKLAVKEEGKWFLVDYDNKKIINDAYDSIYIFSNYELVTLQNEAFIIDDKGNVLSNRIQIYEPADYFNETGLTYEIKGGNLSIFVHQDDQKTEYDYAEKAGNFAKKK